MLSTIISFHHAGLEALENGKKLSKIMELPAVEYIAKMKYLQEAEFLESLATAKDLIEEVRS